MKKDAILSQDRKYRYVLSRIWDESKPMVVIIGLNPSTADEKDDDNTITKCINFAKQWGYGGLYMLNLFAFRATSPSDMFNADRVLLETKMINIFKCIQSFQIKLYVHGVMTETLKIEANTYYQTLKISFI